MCPIFWQMDFRISLLGQEFLGGLEGVDFGGGFVVADGFDARKAEG